MRKTLSLTLAMLFFTAVTPAFAKRGLQGDWELGVYYGRAWLDDYNRLVGNQGSGPTTEIPTDPDDDNLFGFRVGYFFTSVASVEGSIQTISTEFSDPNMKDQDFDLTSYRVNFLWNYRPSAYFRPFWTAGFGVERTSFKHGPSLNDIGYNAGGGARWHFSNLIGARLDARYILTDVGQPVRETQANVEANIGVFFTFGGGPPPDADRDGIEDRRDKCPDTPAGAIVDDKGCPSDSDGDGIVNGVDQCPNTPAGWPVDVTGCPTDGDGDGVMDGADNCADTPAGATVDEAGCESDSDGDGVLDGLDRCPDTPAGATVDSFGCPVDSDHDGVYDGLDVCPDTTYGVQVDEQGCEVIIRAEPAIPEGMDSIVIEGVDFGSESVDITLESATVLDKVAESLIDWPEIRVEVAGHTDSTGSAVYNRQISMRRAQAVVNYLVLVGVPESQLVVAGYGESRPIADNDTEEGKARNRRVELIRIDTPAPEGSDSGDGDMDGGDDDASSADEGGDGSDSDG